MKQVQKYSSRRALAVYSPAWFDGEHQRIERAIPSEGLIQTRNVLDFASNNEIRNGGADARQAILDAQADALAEALERGIAVGDVGSLSYAMPEVWLPAGFYEVSGEIPLGLAANIRGEQGTYIKATDDTFDIFSATGDSGYMVRLKGLHLIGGKRKVVLSRPNMDGSTNVLEDMAFSAGDITQPAVYVNTRSANNLILNPRVLSCPYFLEVFLCDKMLVEGGWVNGYARTADSEDQHKPADSASIVNRAGELTIRDVLFVPETDTAGADPARANTRWIDNWAWTAAYDCHFGAENAGFPIFYNFASAYSGVHPFIPGTGCILVGGLAYAGTSTRADRGAVVCRTAVPSLIIVRDVTGLSDSKVVNVGTMAPGIVAWLAANTDAQNPKIHIDIDPVLFHGMTDADICPAELRKYARFTRPGANGEGNRHTFPFVNLGGGAPVGPIDADIWYDPAAGHFYGRAAGVTKQLDN